MYPLKDKLLAFWFGTLLVIQWLLEWASAEIDEYLQGVDKRRQKRLVQDIRDRYAALGYDTAICTSFRGEKPMPLGVGGAVFTRHEAIYGIADAIVGMNSPGHFLRLHALDVPLSYELPEVLCALGLAQLAEYPQRIQERWGVLASYEMAGVRHAFIPGDVPWKLPVHVTCDALAAWQISKKTPVEVTPPLTPLYSMPPLRKYKQRCLPGTEYLAKHVLMLPILPDMSDEEKGAVIELWQALKMLEAA